MKKITQQALDGASTPSAVHQIRPAFAKLRSVVAATMFVLTWLTGIGQVQAQTTYTITSTPVSILENAGPMEFILNCNPAPAPGQGVTVYVIGEDGSAAVSTGDYLWVPQQQIVFGSGHATKSLFVTIIPDNIIEADEGFSILLGPPGVLVPNGDVAVLGTTQMNGYILNDDFTEPAPCAPTCKQNCLTSYLAAASACEATYTGCYESCFGDATCISTCQQQMDNCKFTAFSVMVNCRSACPPESDPDADSDGIQDACDNCPNIGNPLQTDLNGNGIGDACEPCVSGCAQSCVSALTTATNSCNVLFLGCLEGALGDPDTNLICAEQKLVCMAAAESASLVCLTACPSVSGTDTDGDGANDTCDNCPNIANANQADLNGNGIGDACEPCQATCASGCLSNYTSAVTVCDQEYSSCLEGCLGDQRCFLSCQANRASCMDSAFGNQFFSCMDVCQNSGTADTDGDSVGDVCDNCPNVPNLLQTDLNGNGIGDVCESCAGGGCGQACMAAYTSTVSQCDSDYDLCAAAAFGDPATIAVCQSLRLLCTGLAESTLASCKTSCPPAEVMDTDGDGFSDPCDNCPNVANADQVDLNENGIGDACETAPSTSFVTSPPNGAIDKKVKLNITAKAITGATVYTIEISPFQNFSSGVITMTGSRTQLFDYLQFNTTYYTHVKTDLDQDFGSVTTFKTMTAETISYVTAPKNGAVNQKVNLNITANLVPGATQYTIRISPTSNFSSGVMEQTSANRKMAFSGLSYNTTYYTQVRTELSTGDANCNLLCNAQLQDCLAEVGSDPDLVLVCNEDYADCQANCGSSFEGWGEIRAFITMPAELISYVISPKNNAINQKVSLNIKANLVPNATQYTIRISPVSDFSSGVIEMTGATQTLAFSGLAYNTTYYTQVRTDMSSTPSCEDECNAEHAVCLDGAAGDPDAIAECDQIHADCQGSCEPGGAGWGETRSFTTMQAEFISYVVTPKNNAVNQKVNLNITANLVPGAMTYTIRISPTPDFSSGVIENTSANRKMAFSGLTYNTTYYTQVRTDLSSGPADCSLACDAQLQDCLTEVGGDPDLIAVCHEDHADCQANCALGGWGQTRSFTTMPAELISYVVTPANGATNQKVNLNITAQLVPNATQYTISVSPTSDFSSGVIEQTSSERTIAFGLAYNTTYYTRVRTDQSASGCAGDCSLQLEECIAESEGDVDLIAACNQSHADCMAECAVEDEGWGEIRSFTTMTAEFISYVITPANGAVNQKVNPNIKANLVPGATLYTIRISPVSDFSSGVIQMTGSTQTLAFSGLAYNTTYYTQVRTDMSTGSSDCNLACGMQLQDCLAEAAGDPELILVCNEDHADCQANCGLQGWGETRSFTTMSAESISYVITPANGAVNQNTALNIKSNLVPNATQYTIRISPVSDFSSGVIEMTGPTQTLAFSGLLYNTTYYTKVRTDMSITSAARNSVMPSMRFA